jgi:hypothetical protein
MAFKLLDMAQQRWRRVDGAALLPLVRAGVKFVDGLRKQTLANFRCKIRYQSSSYHKQLED